MERVVTEGNRVRVARTVAVRMIAQIVLQETQGSIASQILICEKFFYVENRLPNGSFLSQRTY